MPFNRPTLPTLIERVRADFENRLSTVGRVLQSSFIYVIARVLAGLAHLLHGHLDFISDQVFPDTAEGDFLNRWASIWGVSRVAAGFSIGGVTFTGTNGSVIPAGTIVQRSDGVEYTVDSEVTILAGTAAAEVTASVAGAVGNTDAASTLTLTTNIVGVNTSVTVGSEGLVNGADEETDAALQLRLLARIKQPPLGGTAADYIAWAKEVAGVTRAWTEPLYLGEGTVGVFFVRDGDAPIFPSVSEVDAVSAYIETKRPVTAHHYVFAPTGDAVDMTIQISPDTSVIRTAIETELDDLFERDAKPGGTIFISRLNEAISTAEGEFDHTLVTPTTNQTSADGFLPERGTVSFT